MVLLLLNCGWCTKLSKARLITISKSGLFGRFRWVCHCRLLNRSSAVFWHVSLGSVYCHGGFLMWVRDWVSFDYMRSFLLISQLKTVALFVDSFSDELHLIGCWDIDVKWSLGSLPMLLASPGCLGTSLFISLRYNAYIGTCAYRQPRFYFSWTYIGVVKWIKGYHAHSPKSICMISCFWWLWYQHISLKRRFLKLRFVRWDFRLDRFIEWICCLIARIFARSSASWLNIAQLPALNMLLLTKVMVFVGVGVCEA